MGDPTWKTAAPRGAGAGVFVDLSGQRARLLRCGGTLVAAGAATILAALTIGFSGLVPPPPWWLQGPGRAHPLEAYPGWAAEPMGGASLAESPSGRAQREGGETSPAVSVGALGPASDEADARRLEVGGETRGTFAEPSEAWAAPAPMARAADEEPRLRPSSLDVPAAARQPSDRQEEAGGESRSSDRVAPARVAQHDRATDHHGSDPAAADDRGRGASPAGPDPSRRSR